MKTRYLVMVIGAIVCLSSALPAQHCWMSQSLRGTWAYTAQGLVFPFPPAPPDGVPVLGLGLMIIDDDGKVSGPGTFIQGGEVFDMEMIDGSISVGANCMGTLRYGLKLNGMLLPGQWVERVVLIPAESGDRHELKTISVSSPLSKPAWIVSAQRIRPGAVNVPSGSH
jgi:hypothetical protein